MSKPINENLRDWFCYAYMAPNGMILAGSDFDTPGRAWQVGLGWPTAAEIEAAKKRGARVMRVQVIEICDAETAVSPAPTFADGMTDEDDRRFLELTNDLTHNARSEALPEAVASTEELEVD